MANSIIESLLNERTINNKNDFSNALREICQKIILVALYKSNFFNKVSFYGGTCLRIFYNLPRFSEDLDFECRDSLGEEEFNAHINKAAVELTKFGIRAESYFKNKVTNTTVISAFIDIFPANLLENRYFNENEKISIKIEAETQIFKSSKLEIKNIYLPVLGKITCYDAPTLFAGKLCAILYRSWGKRVKGRDYFDLYFYLAKKEKINFNYLNEKALASGKIKPGEEMDLNVLKAKLIEKLQTINYEQAKRDFASFVNDENYISFVDKEALIELIKNY